MEHNDADAKWELTNPRISIVANIKRLEDYKFMTKQKQTWAYLDRNNTISFI